MGGYISPEERGEEEEKRKKGSRMRMGSVGERECSPVDEEGRE